MNKRKIVALLLAAVMVCSLFVSPALAAEDAGEPVAISDTKAPKFTDTDGHWAESAIDRWADYGIIQGDGDGTVRPNRTLKRDELATILTRLLGLKEKAPASTFKDVPANAWYADAVLKCAAAGIMLGDGAGHANPESTIDRQQTIVMVARALGAKASNSKSLSAFKDGDAVADWAAPYLASLTDMGILNGLPDGDGFVVAPEDNINRAGLFALLDKAIGQYVVTPTTVTVNDPNKFVVINTDAGEDVTVTGKTAGIVVGAGSTDDVILDNATVGTLKVDAPVDVIIKKGSAVTDLEANAATKVTNDGTVANLNTNADDVIFDGNKPAAVNTAKDVEPAKDSKGNEVTPPTTSTGSGGGSSSGGSSTPPVVSADIVPANIHDNAAENAIADEALGKVTVSSAKTADKTYDVTITGANIMNHDNASNTAGHWVGFGMPAAPEGTTYTYEVDDVEVPSIAGRTQETKGKTYNTVYFSEDTEEEFKDAKCKVVVKDGDEIVATYNVTFNVTFYKADVNVSKSLLDPDDEPFFGDFAINALFPTATQSGYDITLKGEIDPDKLNKNSGENDPKEFTYYGLEVKDENIKTLHNVSATPSDFLASAKWSMAVRIYDSANKKPLNTSHVYQLKDANGRVQDTITVTVDATGCSIKGMKKVTFVDANGDVVDTVYNATGASVTAPEIPASTENVYYTGAWLNAAGEVVTTFTVGEEDATYTAQKFDVTATNLSVRANGPEGNHGPVVDEFKYGEVYAAAGLTFEDSTITVDATALTNMVKSEDTTIAGNLAHIKGNGSLADAVVFGVAYETPTGAKKVAFAGTLTGLDSKADGDYRVLATHPSCYDGTLISYIPVATINPQTKEITFAENGVADSDFCKWVDDNNNVVAVTKTVINIETGNFPEPPAPATYTVTFKDGETVVKTVENVAEGDTVAIPEGKEILVAEGKGFLGWYVGETKYDAATGITADTVVTAKWTETIPTTPGVAVPDNAVVSALGITTEVKNGVVTITIPADVKAKFDAMPDAQKGQLNHNNTLYMRVNSNVPTGADGNWFFQGSTDNGLAWRAKVAVTKDALGSKGINVTEDNNGAITAIGQWFGFATVENETGNNFALRTPAGDWTVIYRWTNADDEMQYTTFEVKFVHATAADDNA